MKLFCHGAEIGIAAGLVTGSSGPVGLALAEEGVDPEQLERIKFQIRAQQIYALDNSDGIAQRYGSALTSGLTVEDVQAWPEILDAVTEEDILAAAEEIFDRESSVTGYLTGTDAQGQDQEEAPTPTSGEAPAAGETTEGTEVTQ